MSTSIQYGKKIPTLTNHLRSSTQLALPPAPAHTAPSVGVIVALGSASPYSDVVMLAPRPHLRKVLLTQSGGANLIHARFGGRCC
jgi:hypothetical protein